MADLFGLAAGSGAALLPYGGGTSVVGGITVRPSERPIITVDLGATAGLHGLDETSQLATFGAGTTGTAVEAALEPHGLTLGHYPQSFEASTVGGWVVTRSAGQQSRGFGRIEDLFAGGHLETPGGPFDLATHPASAAGPDLREVVLGSEGRLGILTEVVVRASRAPGAGTLQRLPPPGLGSRAPPRSPAGPVGPAALHGPRLDPARDRHDLRAGRGRPRDRRPAPLSRLARDGAGALPRHRRADRRSRRWSAPPLAPWTTSCAARSGIAGPGIGSAWRHGRFAAPYLRNALWDAGYAVDTLETATDWTRLPELAADLGRTLRHGLEASGERVHAFSHLSHAYPTGSSLYSTYVFRLAADPDETLERWRTLKSAASRVIVEHGATISHQHGVGVDHAPYLAAEKGPLGMEAIEAVVRTFDPDGRMARGALLSARTPHDRRPDTSRSWRSTSGPRASAPSSSMRPAPSSPAPGSRSSRTSRRGRAGPNRTPSSTGGRSATPAGRSSRSRPRGAMRSPG